MVVLVHTAIMSDEAADPLLAAARELRLRCHMGPLPFDVDAWMRRGRECDLPRLEGGATAYHFEVRDPVYYGGTYFELTLDDDGAPALMVGTGDAATSGPYPATMEGWRAVVAEFNRFSSDSVFGPRKHIFLHRHGHASARAEEDEYSELVQRAMAVVMPELVRPDLAAPAPAPRKRGFWQSLRHRVRKWMI